MKRSILTNSILFALIASAGAGAGYWAAVHRDASMIETTAKSATEKQPLYWYDPMMPDQHFDKPGKSPFMDMELVPKYADDVGAESTDGVRVDNRVQQNLGIRLATVESGSLTNVLAAPASVGFNEREVAIVQTRTAGFVARDYEHAPGDVVAAGVPLLDVLTPEWAGAQAEFLALRQAGESDLLATARQRLRLLGMSEAQIKQVEQTGKVHDTTTISAPIGGMIQSLDIRQGMTLSPGMTVARINGLATVWLEASVPETQTVRIQAGMTASATLTAYPGQTLSGKVIAILPAADAASRTVRVRLVFPNPNGKLRPGMFAQVRFVDSSMAETLLIPSEALIHTGKRTVVIVADTQGRFQPASVTTGAEADGKTAILSGLQAGERVVASGQFLIDSEASLQGVLARLAASSSVEATPAQSSASSTEIEAFGVIEAFGQGEITLSHEPIPALDWPAMTMPFPLASGVDTKGFKVGQRIRFMLEQHGEDMVITRLQPATGARP